MHENGFSGKMIRLVKSTNRPRDCDKTTVSPASVSTLGLTDDMDIVGRTFEETRRYTELKRRRRRPSVTIDGDEFEVVEEFVYLGSLVTSGQQLQQRNSEAHHHR
ncbi:conserved hypothetical protein [Culex quinquefasciatus]|uniref:Uncharacterized protein n=1 Tax=Culex quinquefasciatus TaxID=7176 RepID=B0XC42_CULQU|nr:conserved hypothetical protein [Culex quinquefasciatus]|eukprot:XP_001867214.1 conserved hypothetical protein [Culex quinquefasciatus]